VRAFDLDAAGTFRRARRDRMARRVMVALLVAVVVLAVTGYLGTRERTATAVAADGTELEVSYLQITRRGLSTPLTIRVRRPGMFASDPVVLRISAGYMDMWDQNGVQPEPSAERSEGESIVLEFDPPERSDTLRVDFDSRADPSFGGSRAASIELLDGRSPLVGVDIETRVLP
jgi:hypothetical protein